MSNIGQYIYTVILAALFVSVCLLISPNKGATSSVIKLAIGMFMLIIVLAPLVKIRIGNLTDYIENVDADGAGIIQKGQRSTSKQIEQVIIQQTETYILDKASEFGADLKVEVAIAQNNSYCPEKVTITGSITPLAKEQLSKTIEKDLGIPKELQKWILA